MWYGSLMHLIDRQDTFIASLKLEAYRVGGSVRDELLGRRPKDADYVIRNASLPELHRALDFGHDGRVTPLKLRDGRQVGWRAAMDGLGLMEIALPRTEVSTGPGHRDFEIVVEPGLPLERDAERRDFTINALYRNVHTREVADPSGRGRHDLDHKLLNTTHPDSFRDDPLRILRALRFVATLPGFDLSKVAYAEMRRHAGATHGLTERGVSGTALTELQKLLMGRRVARALRLARDAGVLAVLLPELADMIGFEQESRYHDMTTDEHTFTALDAAAGMHCDLRVRMALLFHDAGKPKSSWKGDDGRLHYYANPELGTEDHEAIGARLAARALARLNAPASLRRDVTTLIERHMVSLSGKTRPAKVRRWRCELGDELLSDLLKHRLADVMGKGTVDYSHLRALARLEQIREDAERAGVPASVKQLAVNGHDAKALGLEGEAIGKALRGVLHEVVSQPDERRLSREWQLSRLGAKRR